MKNLCRGGAGLARGAAGTRPTASAGRRHLPFPRGAARIAGFRFLWRLKRERQAIEGRVTLG
ncbi:hypothetical protein AB0451_28730 [Streptomyces sp. NPDC052000]|uniref:hypothetical protein n=1 Tax=Streptomyces sp. NPDC052000 TaxID=3155676 RepID=UPI00344F6941